ncbi:MAG: hypothetical protein AVDCRST_MAG20-694, partial [uncultured Acidimicrobiales bacterium]
WWRRPGAAGPARRGCGWSPSWPSSPSSPRSSPASSRPSC